MSIEKEICSREDRIIPSLVIPDTERTCTEILDDHSGSKVADIGCGNGKAMLYKDNVLWEVVIIVKIL